VKTKISTKDWRMLSEYLDGQLAPGKRSSLEGRLRVSEELRRALDELRKTRALLRQAPRRRAPRNFMLKPGTAGIRQRKASPLFPAFSAASALAALVTVAIVLFEYLPGWIPRPVAMVAPAEPAAEMMIEKEVPAGEPQSNPPIIFWGGPPQAVDSQLDGLGGGCENCGTAEPLTSVVGQAEDTTEAAGIYETVPQPEAPLAKEGVEPAEEPSIAPLIAAAEETSLGTSQPPPVVRSQPTEPPAGAELTQEDTAYAESPEQPAAEMEGAPNPILGLAPGEVSRTSTPFPTIEPIRGYQPQKGLGIIPYVTAIIAIVSGVIAWFLWRRS